MHALLRFCDPRWVQELGFAQFNSRRFQGVLRNRPGFMNVPIGQIGQLGIQMRRYFPEGSNFRNCVIGLKIRKNGETSAPDSGHPLPARTVVGQIRVDQRVPKPPLPFPSVDQQMFGQEGSGDHAHAIVHPTNMLELAHACIDDGITGLALLPAFERILAVAPGHRVKVGLQVTFGRIGIVGEKLVAEFPPADFLQIRSPRPRPVPGNLPLARSGAD